ncbi:MAG: hypothetical protein Q8K75_04370 [Chlamydiales bacterium]|nr:hypothetical protein [Chlamydiales bacterium]
MDDDFSTGTQNFHLFDWSPISSPTSPTPEKAEPQIPFPVIEEGGNASHTAINISDVNEAQLNLPLFPPGDLAFSSHGMEDEDLPFLPTLDQEPSATIVESNSEKFVIPSIEEIAESFEWALTNDPSAPKGLILINIAEKWGCDVQKVHSARAKLFAETDDRVSAIFADYNRRGIASSKLMASRALDPIARSAKLQKRIRHIPKGLSSAIAKSKKLEDIDPQKVEHFQSVLKEFPHATKGEILKKLEEKWGYSRWKVQDFVRSLIPFKGELKIEQEVKDYKQRKSDPCKSAVEEGTGQVLLTRGQRWTPELLNQVARDFAQILNQFPDGTKGEIITELMKKWGCERSRVDSIRSRLSKSVDPVIVQVLAEYRNRSKD